MLKLRAPLLLVCCIAFPAHAGLFSDDQARKQAQSLEERVAPLEESNKQQTKSLLDLQEQIDSLNGEIRNLRGRNEELAHGLQDAEKRSRDFYIDLDARIRHLEEAQQAAIAAAKEKTVAEQAPVVEPYDPVKENRAFESAYGLMQEGKYADAATAFQDFLKHYPDSVHAANTTFWLGSAQFGQGEYQKALATFESLLKSSPNTAKAPDALFSIAGCQQELNQADAARKTLAQIISKYPDSSAAAKAKELLAPTQQ
ncbi:MAG: tol-pal system protein YbgF [Pseudomonadota bacterium]